MRNIEEKYYEIASLMLRAPVLDWGENLYGTVDEYMEALDIEDAQKLGVVFLNEGKYHWYSDIRGDEIDDGKIYLLAHALKYAMEKHEEKKTS